MLLQEKLTHDVFALSTDTGDVVGSVRFLISGFHQVEVLGEVCPTFFHNKLAADHMAQAMYLEKKEAMETPSRREGVTIFPRHDGPKAAGKRRRHTDR